MVLGKLPVPGRPALVVGAGGGCLDIFTLIYPVLSSFSLSWETARYRLKYCLKGPLNPKQPTNQFLFLYRTRITGWSGGAMVLGKLPVPGHPTNLDNSRAYCACSRCGWGLFGHFLSSIISLFFLPLSGRRPDID